MKPEVFVNILSGRNSVEPYFEELVRLSDEYPWFALAGVLKLRYYICSGDRDKELKMRRRLATSLHSDSYHDIISSERPYVKARNYAVPAVDVDIISDKETTRERKDAPLNQSEILKRFMDKKVGAIRPDDREHPEADTSSSEHFKGTFISEALADIYAKQGLREEAVELYRKLCLKYPKKSAYFASRIAELEGQCVMADMPHVSDDAYRNEGIKFDSINKLDGVKSVDGISSKDIDEIEVKHYGGIEVDEPLEFLCGVIEPEAIEDTETIIDETECLKQINNN